MCKELLCAGPWGYQDRKEMAPALQNFMFSWRLRVRHSSDKNTSSNKRRDEGRWYLEGMPNAFREAYGRRDWVLGMGATQKWNAKVGVVK